MTLIVLIAVATVLAGLLVSPRRVAPILIVLVAALGVGSALLLVENIKEECQQIGCPAITAPMVVEIAIWFGLLIGIVALLIRLARKGKGGTPN